MPTLRGALLIGIFGSAWAQTTAPLRLNEIQIIGSHNSYHAGLPPGHAALLKQQNPKAAEDLDYRHPGLDVQLSSGVRQIELDVFEDSKGGLFANPAYPAMVAKAGLPADPVFYPEGLMSKPGFKVLHVQDLDYRSNCQPFVACLTIVRNWSKAHPGHLPIFILVENKGDTPRPEFMVKPEKFTARTFDALDAEIRSVFSPSEMITPDDVRGSHRTLEEAILTSGWPSLSASRGKVVFLMDQRRLTPLYVENHPSLRGRVLFTNSVPGSPDAAFVEVNDPLTDPSRIPQLVRKGYLVRTMTDSGARGVRAGDVRRRDAAMASGAQMLSTDYAYDEHAPESNYHVAFEQGNIRCNPVLKPAGCDADALRDDRPAQR